MNIKKFSKQGTKKQFRLLVTDIFIKNLNFDWRLAFTNLLNI